MVHLRLGTLKHWGKVHILNQGIKKEWTRRILFFQELIQLTKSIQQSIHLSISMISMYLYIHTRKSAQKSEVFSKSFFFFFFSTLSCPRLNYILLINRSLCTHLPRSYGSEPLLPQIRQLRKNDTISRVTAAGLGMSSFFHHII